ncbi:MAG: thioredoxin [Puniceicoccales bacterium]|jgi:thioredoxin 1|nr:thioredoxin [Puniceicoccales bacterium]
MKELDATNFFETVNSGDAAVVDFWAPWCGPCRAMAQLIEQVSDEVRGFAVVAKVNIDECPELAEKFGIQSIPTIIYFRNGVEVSRSVGMVAKADIIASINAL